MNRVHVITLGVDGMKESLDFYSRVLGFKHDCASADPMIVFMQSEGVSLALYPKAKLAEDINEDSPPKLSDGFGGITLAYNTSNIEEFNAIFDRLKEHGVEIVKEPRRVFWGGISGYFRDINGYYWEATYWEGWSFNPDGSLKTAGISG